VKSEKIGIVLIQLNLRYGGFALIIALVGLLSSGSTVMKSLPSVRHRSVWIDNKMYSCSKME